MSIYSAAEAREIQRKEDLFEAIADWAASTGEQHARDRRWAMALLEVARVRRNLRRAEVAAAANRAAQRRLREAA
jgi:hypothetical protein